MNTDINTLLKMRCSITPLGSPTFTVIPLIFLITVNVGLPRGVVEHHIFNSVIFYGIINAYMGYISCSHTITGVYNGKIILKQ